MNKTVNPQLLTLARQARRLTQAELAARVGVAQGTVSKIEAGVVNVTDADLSRLAAALNFPPHFFTDDRRVEGPGITELYHNRKRQKASATTLHSVYATAAIHEMNVEVLLRSWENRVEDFPSLPIEEFGDPAKTARTVRAILALPAGPVHNLTKAVEDAGGIILRCEFGSRHVDGFSRYRREMVPLFFLNRNLAPDRWRWTVAHEVGHVVMHTSADPYDGMERDADAFAAEFLTPAAEIKPHLVGLSFHKLASMKRQWKVSMQAILMRAHDLGVITERQRRFMFMQLSKAGYRMREPEALDPPAERPGLLRAVIDFHRERLGYSDDDLCYALAISQSDFHSWYGAERGRFQVVEGSQD